jgi:hypothetical protein
MHLTRLPRGPLLINIIGRIGLRALFRRKLRWRNKGYLKNIYSGYRILGSLYLGFLRILEKEFC